jgi:hypothetical protein
MPYVESPLDRIVDVHFGTVGITYLNVSFNAIMIPAPDGIPQYPEDDHFTMTVSTVNIPLLDKTTLIADPEDFVAGFFPGPPGNPGGVISGEYSIGQPELRGEVSGGVAYRSFTASPFYGVGVIEVTISCTLRQTLNADGYRVHATVAKGLKGGPDVVETSTTTEEGGFTITGTLNIV